MVGDGALREPDRLRELGRRRRPLAQQPDDAVARVVGEGAQLLGLGDDEDVVRLVVGSGEIEETVDDCRKIRQPSTVCLPGYGSWNVPSGPAGAGSFFTPGTRLPGTPFTVSVEYANVSTENAIASALTSSAFGE